MPKMLLFHLEQGLLISAILDSYKIQVEYKEGLNYIAHIYSKLISLKES